MLLARRAGTTEIKAQRYRLSEMFDNGFLSGRHFESGRKGKIQRTVGGEKGPSDGWDGRWCKTPTVEWSWPQRTDLKIGLALDLGFSRSSAELRERDQHYGDQVTRKKMKAREKYHPSSRCFPFHWRVASSVIHLGARGWDNRVSH